MCGVCVGVCPTKLSLKFAINQKIHKTNYFDNLINSNMGWVKRFWVFLGCCVVWNVVGEFCQAQPQLQLQLWLRLALILIFSTPPPPTKNVLCAMKRILYDMGPLTGAKWLLQRDLKFNFPSCQRS